MRKLSYWFIVPVLAFSVMMGAEGEKGDKTTTNNQAAVVAADQSGPVAQIDLSVAASAKQVAKRQAWKHAAQTLKPSVKSRVAGPDQRRRMLALDAQSVKRETKYANRNPFGARKPAREHSMALPKFGSRRGFGTDAPSSIAAWTDPTGAPITGYTIGDTIVLTITGTDTVLLELFVDDGDLLFDAAADFWFDADDKGEGAITIVDGDVDDEDEGTGFWKITFDTGENSEGDEFFQIQNERIWFTFTTVNSGVETYEGELSLDVAAMDAATSISGTVTVEEAPAPNVLMVAFPIDFTATGPGDEDDGPPEILFISMTDDLGDYTIVIDDAEANQDFIIIAFDLFGQYWGFYPNPPDYFTYINAGDEVGYVDFDFQEANKKIYGYLTGRLDDQSAATSISGVHIRVGDGPLEMEDTTDATGYYSIPVPSGSYWVEVDGWELGNKGYMVPGNRDNWVSVWDVDSARFDFETFEADGEIAGQVLWADQNPAVDINVWGWVPGFYSDTWTDATGNYYLPVSTYLDSFAFTHRWDSSRVDTNIGYWVGVWEPETIPQPDGRHARAGDASVDFTLYGADATITGTIFNSLGDPVPHANLWAYVPSDSMFMAPIFQTGTRANEEGNYEMQLVGGFDWVVEVFWPETWWPPAFVDSSLTVLPGQHIVRDYTLAERRDHIIVEGLVLNMDGYGIPNANVEIRQVENGDYYNMTNTDGEGYFRLDGVPTYSRFDVVAYAPDSEPQIYDIWTEELDIWLEFWMGGDVNRLTVSGTVSNPDGDPIQDAYVFAFEAASTDLIDVRLTDEAGYYDFFVKPGSYEFRAGSPGLLVSIEALVIESDTTVDFQLDSAGTALTATASGVISDDMDGPLPNTFVLFISDVYMGQTFSRFAGDYELDLVPSANYVAIYSKEGFHEEFLKWTIVDGDNPGLDVTLIPRDYLELHTAVDVPDDHGEQIMLAWHINPAIGGKVHRFELWEIGRGADPFGPSGGTPPRHVGTVPTHPGWNDYSAAVTTLHDGVETWYMVTAHGWEGEFWDSNPNSAMSIDNLPPNIPLGVIVSGGETPGLVVINWEEVTNEPVQYYTIYRAVNSGAFTSIGYSTKPGYVDDLSAQEVGTYEYAVSATDYAGLESDPSAPNTFLSIVDGMGVPDQFALKANYPNPFNPSTNIDYQLSEAGQVSLVIYDLTGNVVNTLVDESQPGGYYKAVWNGRNSRGMPVATGVYFYRLTAGADFVETHKMVLMK